MTKSELYAAAVERIRALEPGQTVTNVAAGETNPRRVSTFLCVHTRRFKNKYGIVFDVTQAKCTDGRDQWLTGPVVIYPGELSVGESDAIWRELHPILFPGD